VGQRVLLFSQEREHGVVCSSADILPVWSDMSSRKIIFRKGSYKDLLNGKQPPENPAAALGKVKARLPAIGSRAARNTTR
jgi:hypothetical protein